ncbi:MAG: SPASM domain-containing protein [Desulfobacterales bacterium]|nr:SPASM domain-containing protein [Desulfobacterales bacterium]
MEEIIKTKNVEFNIYATYKCNLRCTYCCREAQEGIQERSSKIEWTLEDMERFANTWLGDKHIYITWNGGEPALNEKLINDFMVRFPNWEYQMQTNGTMLHRLSQHTVDNIRNFLCSNDGLREHTERYRGEGVFDKIISEVGTVKGRGYKGTVTSRMTFVTDDIQAEEVHRLISEYGYDYVFWQLPDDNLDLLTDKYMENAKKFFREIVDIWFQSKHLLKFIPVMGAVRNVLWPDLTEQDYCGQTQCRVSTNILNLLPSGDMYPCPQLTDKPDLFMGNIVENTFYPSKLQRIPGMDCFDCDVFDLCRTRCMYQKYKTFVEHNEYERKIMEKHCELAKMFLNYIREQDCSKKIESFSKEETEELKNSKHYKYVEVMM